MDRGNSRSRGTVGSLDPAIRERLLDATDRLVQRIGIGKTSMADVARAAGVVRGTLYRYFESREVLFDALTRRAADRFFAGAAAAMEGQPGLSEQLGLSFTVFQAAIAYDADDPLSVSSFVRRYAIGSLSG